MVHLTGRQTAQHTRHQMAPPRRQVPLPRSTPPTPGSLAPCTPTPTTPPRAQIPRLRRRPAQQPRETICRPRQKPNWRPSGTTPLQPGRKYGPQGHHLPVARPPTRSRAQTWHTPPSWLTPCGPQAREAGTGRRPCPKGTPESWSDRQATQPRHPHRQPSHNARRQQRTPQRNWGDLRSSQKRHHQRQAHPKRGNLAGGGAASNTARRPTGHGGKWKRRGIDCWPTRCGP